MQIDLRPLALSALVALMQQAAAAPPAASQPAAAKPAASAPSAPAPTTTQLKPGLWEMTTVVENAATNSRRQLVGRSCITPADATNPQRVVPNQRETGMQCENKEVKREGSNWVWSFECKSADATQNGNGKLSILGDSFLGRGEAELKARGAKPVKVAQTYAGKWLQACS